MQSTYLPFALRRMMLMVAAVAIFLGSCLAAREPNESDLLDRALGINVGYLLPALIAPFLFRLDRPRLLLALAASIGIAVVQLALGVPPTPHAVVAYLSIGGIASKVRHTGDLSSALLAVACGILAGAPLVQDACAPIGLFVGPFIGLVVRLASRPRGNDRRGEGNPALSGLAPAVRRGDHGRPQEAPP
jgi:hypothetical protein